MQSCFWLFGVICIFCGVDGDFDVENDAYEDADVGCDGSLIFVDVSRVAIDDVATIGDAVGFGCVLHYLLGVRHFFLLLNDT